MSLLLAPGFLTLFLTLVFWCFFHEIRPLQDASRTGTGIAALPADFGSTRAADAEEVPVLPVETVMREELVQRVRSEYLEMPGLRLSVPQACRLWGLDAGTCGELMDQLVRANFLCRTRSGSFSRIES
jgi:hypothetical protein